MSLEKIKSQIVKKCEEAEKKILDEASKKIKEINNKASESVKKIELELEQKFVEESKVVENRENSLVNMESQKMEFEIKKEMIDSVYLQAYDKIKNMPKKDREGVTKKLIDLAGKEISVDVIYANDSDKSFCEGKAELKSLDTDGGIICETKDGNVRVNYTFESMFQEMKEKTIKEASRILFE
ncbi:hypothetical protein ISS07_00760 [Candidatus Woesearchaeota archaeon]|nr:hypothetical protein [Candidatus Woesearchaeota archaeon]